ERAVGSHFLSLPAGLTACLETPYDLDGDEKVRLRFGAYVPGMSYLDRAPARTDFVLEHVPSDRPRLRSRGNRITLFAPESAAFPEDLYHLFFGIARRELVKRGAYSVHAACVGRNGRYALLVG